MRYRVDHLAFRTLSRDKAIKFFIDALGYRQADQFSIFFDGEEIPTQCSVLEPSDRHKGNILWTVMIPCGSDELQEYVLSPEIFVSEGPINSIVHNWCLSHHGAGVHHIALQIPDDTTVDKEMKLWQDMGWCEGFSTNEPIRCKELTQVFSKPSLCIGVIFELLERKEAGFCRASVHKLMLSTKSD